LALALLFFSDILVIPRCDWMTFGYELQYLKKYQGGADPELVEVQYKRLQDAVKDPVDTEELRYIPRFLWPLF
jgi:hypothetical protein